MNIFAKVQMVVFVLFHLKWKYGNLLSFTKIKILKKHIL